MGHAPIVLIVLASVLSMVSPLSSHLKLLRVFSVERPLNTKYQRYNTDLLLSLNPLVTTDYFRYFKVDLGRHCPYWAVTVMCTGEPTNGVRQPCSVCTCDENDIPIAVRETTKCGMEPDTDAALPPNSYDSESGVISVTEEEVDAMNSWIDQFTDDTNAIWVDLVRNPESNTAYRGLPAQRVWRAIYYENCFTSERDMCQQEKTFYRLISGLHASISTHIALHAAPYHSDYPTEKDQQTPDYTYYANVRDFQYRVGRYSERVENMALLQHFLLRALHLIRKPLSQLNYGGYDDSDVRTKSRMNDMLRTALVEHPAFNETTYLLMEFDSARIIEQLRMKFINITTLMDCISCEKCRLWGKVQTLGMWTAMNIILGYTNYKRLELVALINTLRQVTLSIHASFGFQRLFNEYVREYGDNSTYIPSTSTLQNVKPYGQQPKVTPSVLERFPSVFLENAT